MKRTSYCKKDIVIAMCCVVFIAPVLGTIGTGGRMRAKEAVCLENLRRWGGIWQIYTDNNSGNFIRTVYWADEEGLLVLYGGKKKSEVAKPGMSESEIHQALFEANKLHFCPLAARTREQGEERRVFQAWEEWDATGSYGINAWVTQCTGGGRGWEYLWKTPYVKTASEVPMVLDCLDYQNTAPYHRDEPPQYEGEPQPPGNINEIKRVVINRHGSGAVNGAFMDFSARKVGLKELWELRWHRQWNAENEPAPEWPEWMKDFKDYGAAGG